MATSYEPWNDRTHSLTDAFATVERALEEVRWRIAVGGDVGTRLLTLLRLDSDGAAGVIAAGDDLVQQTRVVTTPGD